ncbi:unnamed protein product [Caretta caretta]
MSEGGGGWSERGQGLREGAGQGCSVFCKVGHPTKGPGGKESAIGCNLQIRNVGCREGEVDIQQVYPNRCLLTKLLENSVPEPQRSLVCACQGKPLTDQPVVGFHGPGPDAHLSNGV